MPVMFKWPLNAAEFASVQMLFRRGSVLAGGGGDNCFFHVGGYGCTKLLYAANNPWYFSFWKRVANYFSFFKLYC